MKIPICDGNGKKIDEMTLNPLLFEEKVNKWAIHQDVRAQRDALRQGTASTKTRNEAAGGGVKPWRQKGTGRARAGSIRSPLWKGGGVTFGPKPKDYSQAVPKKVKRLALRSVLSEKAKDSEIIVIDKFDLKKPATKKASDILKKIGVVKNATVVLAKNEEVAAKSLRNIPKVKVCPVTSLGTYSVSDNEVLVFTRESLTQLMEARGNEKVKE
ncbi:MAG: 50S ribosomal protein L4 [Deltaproteobacteria bacterium]|nr:50S ribosomal protein L4 [Deltaproteobacteria bacterium]